MENNYYEILKKEITKSRNAFTSETAVEYYHFGMICYAKELGQITSEQRDSLVGLSDLVVYGGYIE